MKETLKTIMVPYTHSLVIDRSEFITHLFPTSTNESALEAIASVRKTHYNATHNCTAYVIGRPISIQKTNDDGEPKGTAGLPMLQSLTYQNMTDITAVVTRYFGGIKLGAGGLIRAYAGSVSEALLRAPLATYETLQQYNFTISYDELNSIYHLRDTTELFTILDTTYGQDINLLIECLAKNSELLQQQFTAHLFRELTLQLVSTTEKKFLLTP